MIVLIILLALVLLIFFVPYGVDAAYENGQPRLSVRAGPISIRIFPRKPKTPKQLERARKKKEKKAAKAAEKKAKEAKKPSGQEEQVPADHAIKVKKQRNLDMEPLMTLLEMGIRAIRRFFRSFSVDLFRLHLIVAGSDPYKTAMEYGYLCFAVEGLPDLAGDKITLKKRDIDLSADFAAEKPVIDFRIIITLQLFKIVHMAVAFGVEFIIWSIKNRKEKKAAAAEERE